MAADDQKQANVCVLVQQLGGVFLALPLNAPERGEESPEFDFQTWLVYSIVHVLRWQNTNVNP